jgi:hypothetical protein
MHHTKIAAFTAFAITVVATPATALAAPLKLEGTPVQAVVTPVPRSNPDLDGIHSPMATRLPWLTGTAQVGRSLRCHPGAWKGSATFTFRYHWKRGRNAVAKDQGATYRPRSSDTGKRVRCIVTATNKYGSGSAPSHSVTIRR